LFGFGGFSPAPTSAASTKLTSLLRCFSMFTMPTLSVAFR
jgi:hypothetical protein